MAITIRNLKATTLPTSTSSSVFTPTSNKAAVIKNILMTNKSTTSTETVNLYLLPGGGTSPGFRVTPMDMKIPPGVQVVLDSEITLAMTGASQDALYGSTSTLSTVDIVINGFERDL